MKLTKKQIKERKRLRYIQTEIYRKKMEKRERNRQLTIWSLAVKGRDGSKCVVCGAVKGLNAHHIIVSQNPLFRFDINNGIALCQFHHQFSREISAHQESFTFFLWFMEHRKEQFEYLKGKLGENKK